MALPVPPVVGRETPYSAPATALAPLLAALLALLALLLALVVGLLAARRVLVGVAGVARLVVLAVLVLLVFGVRPIVDPLRVLHLDVRLEAGEIGLHGPLHEAEAGGHLLHHPVGFELHVDHHAG